MIYIDKNKSQTIFIDKYKNILIRVIIELNVIIFHKIKYGNQ